MLNGTLLNMSIVVFSGLFGASIKGTFDVM